MAAAVTIVVLACLSACSSNGGAQTAATAAPALPVSASPTEGTPEWAAKWLGDREGNRNASRVVGRYAQLAIVQHGGRQGSAELCDAEWAKFTAAQRVMVDREGFDDGCRVPPA
ncbi:hypothetical protein ACIQ9P_04140 [Kitasatospora sp. NPDC094019]|uniref:hypothetical protein n=1 Tax=Kitasatospora sp. NPDC094019 TaxID=3364091 RepID=UPI0037F3FFBD